MKKAIGWLVGVGVLLGVGFGGDFLARTYVEGRAAAAVAALPAAGASQKAEVGLGGWPFTVAFLTKSVPRASLDMASFDTSFDGHFIALTDLKATSGTAQIDDARLTAFGVSGTAKLSYLGFGAFLGKSVTPGESGRVRLSSTIDVSGHQMAAVISAQPVLDVDAQTVRFEQPTLLAEESSEEIESAIGTLSLAELSQSVELHLPGTCRLTSLKVGPEDLDVAFAADSVSVPLR
jgi:hypothetical protein